MSARELACAIQDKSLGAVVIEGIEKIDGTEGLKTITVLISFVKDGNERN